MSASKDWQAPRRERSRRVRGAALAGCAVMLAACGTRVTRSEVIRAEGAAAVSSGAATAQTPSGGTVAPQAGGSGVSPGSAATSSGQQTPGAPSVGAVSSGQAAPAAQSATPGSPAQPTPAGGASTAACTSQGAPLVLGQVYPQTGLISQDLGNTAKTLAVWARYVNTTFGGVACHPVTVYSEDDGSDPGRSASNVNDLVQNKHAVAMVSAMVPISISGYQSAVDQNHIPTIGGDLFATVWNADPLLYPVGTVVDANAYGSMQSLASAGHNKVAVLYCVEAAVCPPYKDAVANNAAKAGATIVYTTSVSITQPDYTSQCQSAKNAGATQIAMILDGAAVARLARSCQSIGYNVPFAVASLGVAFDQSDPNVRAQTVTIANAVAPWVATSVPAVSTYLNALKQYAPGLPAEPDTILAWTDGMMVKAAIDALGPSARATPITTAMIMQGLSTIKNETLGGLIAPQTYSSTRGPNPPNHCFFPVKFGSNGIWTGPDGSNYACLG